MKEVKYSRNIVDIHPLVVYFVLSDDEHERYADDVKRLNDYAWMTLGVFEYKSLKREAIEWGEMSEEFGAMLNDCNMVVKLMDSGDDQSRYLFNRVDLDGDGDAVVGAIRSFVLGVSERDVELTDAYIASLRHCKTVDDDRRLYYLGCIKDLLLDALKQRKGRTPLWGEVCTIKSADRSVMMCCECVTMHNDNEVLSYGLPRGGFGALQDDIYNVLKRTQSKKSASREICKLLEEMGLLEREEIVGAKQTSADGKNASCDDVENDNKIFIVRTLSPNGRKKWGVETIVNGKKYTVLFSGRDSTMLYYAVLLRTKMGQKLYLKELYDTTKEDGGGRLIRKWLAPLYNIIYRFDDRPYSEWADMFIGQQHAVNQAKCACNRALKKAMGKDADAYLLEREDDEHNKRFYAIGCDEEDIYLPKELDIFLESAESSSKY